MTLADYQTAWETDAKIEADNLELAAIQVPILHARWWKHYSTERLRYKKLQAEYKVLYRQKWEWYLGRLDDAECLALKWEPQPLRILSNNVGVYLDADRDLQENLKAQIVQEETCRFLEDVIKSINNRGYTIKTAVDFLKFKMGV